MNLCSFSMFCDLQKQQNYMNGGSLNNFLTNKQVRRMWLLAMSSAGFKPWPFCYKAGDLNFIFLSQYLNKSVSIYLSQ